MDQSQEELTQLVESIVEPMIDVPDALSVTSELDGNSLLINIEVDPDDVGKVIGRGGRVIKSIRTLARAAASRKDMTVDVELLD